MDEQHRRDLIIIGAGLNGLTAGTAYLLGCEGRKNRVLLIEKNAVCGGYVASYARQGWLFETCQMTSDISDILRYLGIGLEMKEFGPDFIRLFVADTAAGRTDAMFFPSGASDFEEMLRRMFPSDAENIKRFFDYSGKMYREIDSLKYAPGFADTLRMLSTCPRVIANASKTFAAYAQRFGLERSGCMEVFQIFSSLCGLPNGAIAALLTVGVMFSLFDRAYRPAGLFTDLPHRLRERYLSLGGELLFHSEVSEIITGGGAVCGVRLANGGYYTAESVVSTADVKSSLGVLLGAENDSPLKTAYRRRVGRIRMTPSAFTVNIGLTGDPPGIEPLRCGYAVLASGPGAFRSLFAGFEKGECLLSENLFHIGISCPPKREGRKPVLSLQAVPMPAHDWITLRAADYAAYREKKENTASLIIDIVRRYLLPELSAYIGVLDIATPATYARYSGSPTGSIYDMACVPDNFGRRRLPVKTPVEGLYIPKFAHGVFGSMNSGMQVADMLLDGRIMHGNSRLGGRE
ncbi:MAG TPA: NAD(P)/FAD-dependent oxidoreductase [Clostridiales bacterium]|nr:NAD(P)/FAD-dependent oxidoreductase [Clostridiales bacterium]